MSSADVIDGRVLAKRLRRTVNDAVDTLRRSDHLQLGLAVVLVGDDAASQIYVRKKSEQCEETGIKSFLHPLPADIREEDLLTLVRGLNLDHRVNGILVQLPLPAHISADRVIETIDPAKDVDGFHVVNVGRLAAGMPGAMVPCTPAGCLLMLQSRMEHLDGLRAVIVGRSNIVGKPLAQLLLRENCTVTVAHSKTRDLADECRRADVLVAAVGRPQLIRGDWIRPGATVLDVGINRIPISGGKTRIVGDVHYDEAVAVAGAISPVPGGIGPMTVACLMRNTVIAACRQHGLEPPAMQP